MHTNMQTDTVTSCIHTYMCIRTHTIYAYVGNRDRHARAHTHTHAERYMHEYVHKKRTRIAQ
jgi:hypothetical protein